MSHKEHKKSKESPNRFHRRTTYSVPGTHPVSVLSCFVWPSFLVLRLCPLAENFAAWSQALAPCCHDCDHVLFATHSRLITFPLSLSPHATTRPRIVCRIHDTMPSQNESCRPTW